MRADAAVLPVYDGDGGRVARTEGGATTRYLVDDLNPTGYAQVVEEVVGGSVVAQYTVGKLRVSQRRLIAGTNWQVSYYGYDGGGSVRELLDGTGAVTDTYTYDAFGNVVAQTGTTVNPYLYRAEYFDQTLGMYYLRARYHVPRTGRFLTADKWEPSELTACSCSGNQSEMGALSAGTAHLFAYTPGDPVNYMDPSGRGFVDQALLFGQTVLRVTVPRLIQAGVTVANRYYVYGTMYGPELDGYLVLVLCAVLTTLGIAGDNISISNSINVPLSLICAYLSIRSLPRPPWMR